MALLDSLTKQEMEELRKFFTALKKLNDNQGPDKLDLTREADKKEHMRREAELTAPYKDLLRKATNLILKELLSPQEVTEFLTATFLDPQPPAPQAATARAKQIEYPLDKINSKIWNLLEKDTKGQLALKAEKAGSDKALNIYYAIDFDELGEDITITRRLTPFDKRVYIATSALFNAGNNVITLTQIYYAMGYTGKPGKSDLERINTAITKMTRARIYVNNEQEAAAYRYNKFVYDGSLLPLERGTATVNGLLSEAAIHIFREPPVISFAKQRRQITTIDVKLLQSPISKTDQNLLLDDYLIERISRAKKGQQTRRILLKTIYDKVGAGTAKQRQRLPAKIKRYLDHYQQCGMIQRYTMEKDGITVYFQPGAEGELTE